MNIPPSGTNGPHFKRNVPSKGVEAEYEPYGRLAMRMNATLHRIDRDALRFICQTHQQLPARPEPNQRLLALFAHYDPHGVVDPYVVYYIHQLHRLGATVIFVSGSPSLTPQSVDPLRPFCAGIYTRNTLGLDFGSWHLAWNILHDRGWSLNDFDRLVLANDSVYGPLFPLEEMWNSFHGADIYGSIENLEHKPHLQSFFVAFDLNARTRRFLQDFWSEFRYVVNKWKLIMKYEVGLTVRARQAGLRVKAYVSDSDVKTALSLSPNHQHYDLLTRTELNNVAYFYDGLIEHLRYPFLKTSLPRTRFPQHDSLDHLAELIKANTTYPFELIEANLERLRNGPPGPTSRA